MGIWLIVGIVVLALLTLPFLFASRSSPAKSTKSSKNPKGSTNKIRTVPTNEKLTRDERNDMLGSVKNLAKENPSQVASLLRDWMKEDK